MRKKIFNTILLLIIFGFSFFCGKFLIFEKLKNYLFSCIFFPFPEATNYFFPPHKTFPEISAKSFILVKTNLKDFDKILAQKNKDLILPIASLSKLMTATLVFEENYNLEDEILISPTAANQEPAPIIGSLRVGERFKIKNLLNLSLVYSNNSAAFALAEHFKGDFIQRMNQKAKEIGMENTFFVNPTGLEPKNFSFSFETKENFNFSTASDLVKLAKYILQHHPIIFEISKTPPSFKLENGIFDIFLPFHLIGGKTGYADEAGGCILLVFSDSKNPNIFYIGVILGTTTKEKRIEEMQKLINWLAS